MPDCPGSGMHINFSVHGREPGTDLTNYTIAGILENIASMTVFLNPTDQSYARLGLNKAPRYISWSSENRSQLIRVPAAFGEFRRAELRSPDPLTNPYLAYALIIRAGLQGIRQRLPLPEPADINLFTADAAVTSLYRTLPASLTEAAATARASSFIRDSLPEAVIRAYTDR